MIGYVRKFDVNTTMSFKINDKQLLKKCSQIWKNVKSVLNIKFDGEPIYGDNDKYIKTKTKIYSGSVNTIFKVKICQKKKHEQVFINNNAIFCYQNKEKVSPQTFLEECKYEPKKIKTESLIDDDLENSSSDESSSESDNDFNDETESDDEKDNDESKE